MDESLDELHDEVLEVIFDGAEQGHVEFVDRDEVAFMPQYAEQIGMLNDRTADVADEVANLSNRVEEMAYQMNRLKQIVSESLNAIRDAVREESLVVGDSTPLEDFLGQFIGEVDAWS